MEEVKTFNNFFFICLESFIKVCAELHTPKSQIFTWNFKKYFLHYIKLVTGADRKLWLRLQPKKLVSRGSCSLRKFLFQFLLFFIMQPEPGTAIIERHVAKADKREAAANQWFFVVNHRKQWLGAIFVKTQNRLQISSLWVSNLPVVDPVKNIGFAAKFSRILRNTGIWNEFSQFTNCTQHFFWN